MLNTNPGKSDGTLRQAVETTLGKPYLGSMPELEQVIRDAIGAYMGEVGKAKSHTDVEVALKAAGERLGNVLMGRDDRYAPMPGWNAPDGRIAAHLARTFEGFDDFSSEDAITRSATQVFIDATEILAKRSNGEIDDAGAQDAVETIVEGWTSTFLGIPTSRDDESDA